VSKRKRAPASGPGAVPPVIGERTSGAATHLLLGHGASGTAASMRPWVESLGALGVVARALDLPRSSSERAIGVFRDALATEPGAALGGHSFGGRMASMLAAEQSIRALVLLSYPLHRPGHPEELRTGHLPRITCPMLFLSGDRDQFAKVDLLRSEVAKLPNAQLMIYPGLGHGLLAVREDAAARIADFLSALT
jgi:predicted alpha/beta-hydrolase family hydrolase